MIDAELGFFHDHRACHVTYWVAVEVGRLYDLSQKGISGPSVENVSYTSRTEAEIK